MRKRRARGSAAKNDNAAAVPVAVARSQFPKVSLQEGSLTIAADSSDLQQILERLSATGSMTVEGQAEPGLVSGVFGPGKPREVLAQLLEAARYNFVMEGETAEGLPRELVLTSRKNNSATAARSERPNSAVSHRSSEAASAQESPATEPPANRAGVDPAAADPADPVGSEPLGPGAMAHVPPNEAEDGSASQDPGARMQQHLQKLQQLQQPQGAPQ